MRPPLLVALGLTLATLACNLPGQRAPDIDATVNAVSTSVQLTLDAQPASAVPTATPPPLVPPAPLPATPTQFIPPTNLPPSVTPPADVIRPNGSPVHAARLANAPRIDGDVSEWTLFNFINQATFRPENWTGPADASAAYTFAWDAQNLYLAVQVTDDKHVQTEIGELIFKGDSLELLFDSNLSGDFNDTQLSGDDFQLGLSPATLLTEPPETYLWFPAAKKGTATGVTLAVKPSAAGEGYTLEATLPWALFGLTPAPDNRFGFVLSVSDNDNPATAEQQTLIASVAARRLTNPATWGTLILDQ